MKDFIKYILKEAKEKRIKKDKAIEFIKQFENKNEVENESTQTFQVLKSNWQVSKRVDRESIYPGLLLLLDVNDVYANELRVLGYHVILILKNNKGCSRVDNQIKWDGKSSLIAKELVQLFNNEVDTALESINLINLCNVQFEKNKSGRILESVKGSLIHLQFGLYSEVQLIHCLQSLNNVKKIYIQNYVNKLRGQKFPELTSVNGFYKTLLTEYGNVYGTQIELSDSLEKDLIPIIIQEIAFGRCGSVRYDHNLQSYSKVYQTSELNLKDDMVFPPILESGILIVGSGDDISIHLGKYLNNVGAQSVFRVSSRNNFRKFKSEIKEILSKENVGCLFYFHNKILKSCRNLKVEDYKESLENTLHQLQVINRLLSPTPECLLCLGSSILLESGYQNQAAFQCTNSFLENLVKNRNRESQQLNGSIRTCLLNLPLLDLKEEKISQDELTHFHNKYGMGPANIDVYFFKIINYLSSFLGQEKNIEEGRVSIFYGERDVFSDLINDIKGNSSIDILLKKSGSSLIDQDSSKQILNYLKELIARLSKIPVESLDVNEDFGAYGIDSLIILKLNNELNKDFKKLPSTLFFQKKTIKELSQYFLDKQKNSLSKLFGLGTLSKVNEDSLIKNLHKGASLKKQNKEESNKDKIAITGMHGRYPGSPTIFDFWENLKSGNNCISEIPRDFWDYQKIYDADSTQINSLYSKWGGFINDVDKFDPLFFHITPRDAEGMDPQSRLFLESAWHLLEDAGYSMERVTSVFNNQIGVFVGASSTEYQLWKTLDPASEIELHGLSYIHSISNRVSYHFGLLGPSISIDTACSSSLIAFHQACKSIQLGECKGAIAGGVNLSIHPNKYQYLSLGKFLSTEGKCRSFGDGGDGYVPGEGVGSVLLRPLSEAIISGDNIYGVVLGSSMNHGGKTAGFSVPNPNAQSELVVKALSDSNIDSKSISYIEAHGTGTVLGDPIEIAGLTKAFGGETTEQFCAIGSSKSIIGHLESASGVAQIAKVLLQFKHKKLVPSLYTKELNPNIEFKETPFYVQSELEDWIPKHPQAKDKKLKAGVSSFGAGGSNAHVILEEYIQPKNFNPAYSGPRDDFVFTLSARNSDRLNVYLLLVHDYLIHEELPKKIYHEQVEPNHIINGYFEDFIYTFQVGRTAMEERLSIVVNSSEELMDKISRILDHEIDIPGVFRNNIKKNKENLDSESSSEKTESWIINGDLLSIGEAWANGHHVPWSKLNNTNAHIISAPVYPFVRNSYWINEKRDAAQELIKKITYSGKKGMGNGADPIHPLLTKNTSTLMAQSFEIVLTGEESFFKDHMVNGVPILPGSAYVEIAIQAYFQSVDRDYTAVAVKNMGWVQPYVFNNKKGYKSLKISLTPSNKNNQEVQFEIYDYSGIEKSKVLFCMGYIGQVGDNKELPSFEKFENKFIKIYEKNTNEFYTPFDFAGLIYGATHRAVKRIVKGSHKDFGDVVLADLLSPQKLIAKMEDYYVSPGYLDSIFQCCGEFVTGKSAPALPFSMDSLQVLNFQKWMELKKDPNVIFKVVGLKDQQLDDDNLMKANIYLFSQNGELLISISGISSRYLLAYQNLEVNNHQNEDVNRIYFYPDKMLLENKLTNNIKISKGYTSLGTDIWENHMVILVGESFENNSLSEYLQNSQITYLRVNENQNLAAGYSSLSLKVFQEIKSILISKSKGSTLIQIVTGRKKGAQSLNRGLIGLLKTLSLENPKYHGQLLEIHSPENVKTEALVALLEECSFTPSNNYFVIEDDHRVTPTWKEYIPHSTGGNPYKENGVYLITGGVGGLGLIFAQDIITKINKGTVLLTGRSDWDELKNKSEINELGSLKMDVAVDYFSMDISNEKNTKTVLTKIEKNYGLLNGVIHGAGLLKDGFIIKKTKEEFKEVLDPKVNGLYNLDKYTSHIPLDYFAAFSSGSGAFGNVGQCDYAAANAFMDEFIEVRDSLVSKEKRLGKSIAINWPLWKEGGMRVDSLTQKSMLDDLGIVPMEIKSGLQAFYDSIDSPSNQLVVLEGYAGRIRKLFARSVDPREKEPIERESEELVVKIDRSEYPKIALAILKEKLSIYIKSKIEDVDEWTPFEDFGVDSVLVMQLTNELEKVFGSLSKTLFFEYQNLSELADFIASEFPDELSRILQNLSQKEIVSEARVVEGVKINPAGNHVNLSNRFASSIDYSETKKGVNTETSNDVAIVGMAGKYPHAVNLEEFWQNLQNGKNCIDEIPPDRWDYRLYYDENKSNSSKRYSKWGGFINGVDEFDPIFFKITPREAEVMDPQGRLFLECCYHTIEDGGYTPSNLLTSRNYNKNYKVGVYVGVMYEEYQLFAAQEQMLGKSTVVLASPSSIANRVSYTFNFQGPSLAVDTMCSSSLTAIHLACKSIRDHECDVALAGGVNVSIHPYKYLALGLGKLVSSNGICSSFGKGGDGYVPGEGVGSILLKSLSNAEKDGDNIYGIIKGSAVNHGGKTNGYSVPNPNAQSSVIAEAIENARVKAENISYIEAHGTGTSLGDPIEFTGLKNALNDTNKHKFHCKLGSVKSNIGHLEGAAGIAGIHKLLLQLKHKKLVPSLHSKKLNPNIDFAKSGFTVQQKLEHWEPLKGNEEALLLSGVSSFGAGGGNAHIILEEYKQEINNNEIKANKFVVVLSAKTSEQLRTKKTDLLEWIKSQESSLNNIDLLKISYTLLLGKEALEFRWGVVVKDFHGLIISLEGAAQSKENSVSNVIVKRPDPDLDKTIHSWARKKKYSSLIENWLQGYPVQWNGLFEEDKKSLKIINFPLYPFAREKYWVPGMDPKNPTFNLIGKSFAVPNDLAFPLLTNNESKLFELQFVKIFTGNEEYLQDHKINGVKILPGSAYVEMLWEAILQGLDQNRLQDQSIEIRSLTWERPFVFEENSGHQSLKIIVTPNNSLVSGSHFKFKFESSLNSQTQYCSGDFFLKEKIIQKEARVKDLEKGISFKGSDVYDLFNNGTLSYGPSHQNITQGWVEGDYAYVEIENESTENYLLAPGVLDSIFQSAIAFNVKVLNKDSASAIPYTVNELIIYTSHEQLKKGKIICSLQKRISDKNPKLIRYDMDVSSEEGALLLSIIGLSGRILQQSESQNQLINLKTVWHEIPQYSRSLKFKEEQILLFISEDLSNTLNEPEIKSRILGFYSEFNQIEIEFLGDSMGNIEENLEVVFSKIKDFLSKSKNQPKGICWISESGNLLSNSIFAGLKSLSMENPFINGGVLELDVKDLGLVNFKKIPECIHSLFANSGVDHLKEEGSKVFKKNWEINDQEFDKHVDISLWKDQSTYLVIGGLGGVGLQIILNLLESIEENNYSNVELYIWGRRPLAVSEVHSNIIRVYDGFNSGKSKKSISNILSKKINLRYRQVDVSSKLEVDEAINKIKASSKTLTGVIHCAGINRDNFFIKKSLIEFKEVLSGKVAGTINISEAAAPFPLDYFIVCSSLSGIFGNIGQFDYAMANGFLDSFCTYRNDLVEANRVSGKSLSINWPLWKEGGMSVENKTVDFMINNMGIHLLSSSMAVKAMKQALNQANTQWVPLEGDFSKLKETFKPVSIDISTNNSSNTYIKNDGAKLSANNEDVKLVEAIRKHVETFVKSSILKSTKLPLNRLDSKANIENFGLDSVVVLEITDNLEELFGTLPKTLFFEYQTIEELADWFLEGYPELCQSLLKESKNNSTMAFAKSNNFHNKKMIGQSPVSSEGTRQNVTDIAVIGMAGRYPLAENLQEFWQNLMEGKDCIQEIPKKRWDHSLIYNNQKGCPGKTYAKWGGFLSEIDCFDSLFFNISPREAEIMDPQERLFLQCVYHTLESAGYTKENLDAYLVSVFVGSMYEEYQLFGAQEQLIGNQISLSGNPSSIANRVSWYFDFNGPSMAVDTMCSSSLTAIHLACESIKSGTSDAAIAGGVNLSIHPNKFVALGLGYFASSDGKCRSFGEGGDGYVPGEGVGAVLLKALESAKADGDMIYGVIKSSALNHGGHVQNYTVPNPKSQAQVISRAIEKSHMDPGSISYLEAHGTGTDLGDPIEIAGLNNSYGIDRENPCAIGSVKSNIGHGEAAAGIAGLHKILLQMKHKKLVPSIHSEELNSKIQWEKTKFEVQNKLTNWERCDSDEPLRAGLSGFGAGGSNAHLIVEEYLIPDNNAAFKDLDQEHIIYLSAKQIISLEQKLTDLKSILGSPPQVSLQMASFNINCGRQFFGNGVLFIVNTLEDLVEKINKAIQSLQTIKLDPTSYAREVIEGSIYYQIVDPNIPASINTFSEEEEFGEIVSNWFNKKDYNKIARLWSKGVDVNWQEKFNNHYPHQRNAKMDFPGYPFEKTKFWVPSLEDESGKPLYHRGIMRQTISKPLPTEPINIIPHGLKRKENRFEEYLLQKLSRTLKLSSDKIHRQVPFEQYGIDSVMVLQLTDQLESDFGELPKTLFFEYRHLADLTKYFQENHSEIIKTKFSNQNVSSGNLENLPKEQIQIPFTSNTSLNDIAVIGMAGVYPQANNLDEFWNNLIEAKDSIVEIPIDRWSLDNFYSNEKGAYGKSYSKWGGFIEDVKSFDPLFFSISKSEAVLMDPQERLFLQTAYHALEDSGYPPNSINRLKQKYSNGCFADQAYSMGVFAGVMYEEYQLFGAQEQAIGNPQVLSGISSIIANRVSYALNLNGPCVVINTMCSSSLTSMHLAMQSLNSGECDLALAGGVNLSLHPNKYLALSLGRFASSKGRCESFGEGGDGYVPGEGVGALVLKPLEKAEKDNDNIYGVLRGSSINHGGKSNGFSVPNPKAQAEVIERCLQSAGLSSEDIDYVEAHGTGTSLGDPIEISGLTKIFGSNPHKKIPIGSVKSNLGHLESAAGVASVTKVLLQLKKKKICPSLHSKKLNPLINFDKTSFLVNQEIIDWNNNSKGKIPLRAGISSFGAGGSNAHIILEEYIPVQTDSVFPNQKDEIIFPIIITANTKQQLEEKVKQLKSLCIVNYTIDVEPLSYTLLICKEQHEYRYDILCSTMNELKEKLNDYTEEKVNRCRPHELLWDQKVIQISLSELEGQRENYLKKIMDKSKQGYWVDWTRLYSKKVKAFIGKKPHLLAYPFKKEEFWFESSRTKGFSLLNQESKKSINIPAHLVNRISDEEWEIRFNGQEFFIRDHVISGISVLPGVYYLEILNNSLCEYFQVEATKVLGETRNLAWENPYRYLSPEKSSSLFLKIFKNSNESNQYKFEFYSESPDGAQVNHCKGNWNSENSVVSEDDYKNWKAERSISANVIYNMFENTGLEYDIGHKGIKSLKICPEGILSEIELPDNIPSKGFVIHPTLLDSALQSCIGFNWKVVGNQNSEGVSIPFSLEKFGTYHDAANSHPSQVKIQLSHGAEGLIEKAGLLKLDLELYSDKNTPWGYIKGLVCRQIRPPKKEDVKNERDVEIFLVRIIAAATHYPASDIEIDVPLDRYGLESVMMVDLTGQLEKVYGSLSKTLFFEFLTIQELVQYFNENFSTNEIKNEALIGKRKFQEQSDIAIIGMSAKLPQANNLDEFWENLIVGKDCIEEIPASRWSSDIWQKSFGLGNKQPKCGVVNDVDLFDPLFFEIAPSEAKLMDPQERLLLETAWHTFEDAGVIPSGIADRNVSVYVGIMNSTYNINSRHWSAPNRLSWLFNFTGPTMAVDTACSSSLTGLHLAMENLNKGESKMALVAGVNIISDPIHLIGLQSMNMLSDDNRCKTFGENANGFADGEAVISILLKPLGQAEKDDDRIYGVLLSSAINGSGRTNGFTVPSPKSQGDLLVDALQKANISGDQLRYIEAHGTGTSLGDPIEIEGLSKALRKKSKNNFNCSVASVKSNIGHCESASGLAGLTKILLQFQNKILVPSIHSEKLNPHIDFDSCPFSVQRHVTEIKSDGPIYSALSSFGAGGANAHIILKDYKNSTPQGDFIDLKLVYPFSAKSSKSLVTYLGKFASFINDSKENPLDIAFTLQTGRESFYYRAAFVSDSLEKLRVQINGLLANLSKISDMDDSRWKSICSSDSLHSNLGFEKKDWKQKSTRSEDSGFDVVDIKNHWLNGGKVIWTSVNMNRKNYIPQRIKLPYYCFDQQQYWIPIEDRFHSASLFKSMKLSELSFSQGNENHLEKSLSEISTLESVIWSAEVLISQSLTVKDLYIRDLTFNHFDCSLSQKVELHQEAKGLWKGALKEDGDQISQFTIEYSPFKEEEDDYQLNQKILTKKKLLKNKSFHFNIDPTIKNLSQSILLGLQENSNNRGITKKIDWEVSFGINEIEFLDKDVLSHLKEFNYSVGQGLISSLLVEDVSPQNDASVFNLFLLNSNAKVLLLITELKISRFKGISPIKAEKTGALMYLEPYWRPYRNKLANAMSHTNLCLIQIGSNQTIFPSLKNEPDAHYNLVHQKNIFHDDKDLAEDIQSIGLQLFNFLKTIPSKKSWGKFDLVVVCDVDCLNGMANSGVAIIKSFAQEWPKLRWKWISTDSKPRDELFNSIRSLESNHFYQMIEGECNQQYLKETFPGLKGLKASISHSKGHYLISGGMGAIGLLTAENLAEKDSNSRVVLLGRTASDKNIQYHVSRLHDQYKDAEFVYYSVDISELEDLQKIVKQEEYYGDFTGVVHSAGITKDRALVLKPEKDFLEVLKVKVNGVVNLDLCTKNMNLNFFCSFSSVSGFFGNTGQCDYAFANNFMDIFISKRSDQVNSGKRQGHSFSINWPYWEEGAMKLSDENLKVMKDLLGVSPLSNSNGTKAFWVLLNTPSLQTLVMYGNPIKIKQVFNLKPLQGVVA